MAQDCKKCGAYEHALAEARYEGDKAREENEKLRAEVEKLRAQLEPYGDSLFAVAARKSQMVYVLTGRRL